MTKSSLDFWLPWDKDSPFFPSCKVPSDNENSKCFVSTGDEQNTGRGRNSRVPGDGSSFPQRCFSHISLFSPQVSCLSAAVNFSSANPRSLLVCGCQGRGWCHICHASAGLGGPVDASSVKNAVRFDGRLQEQPVAQGRWGRD